MNEILSSSLRAPNGGPGAWRARRRLLASGVSGRGSLLIGAVGLALLAGPAWAKCAYPVDGGCATAPVAGSFIQPSFYAYATAKASVGSGQTWAGGSHPWNWNSAGVDYAVGYPTGTALQDAYTAPASGAGSPGVLPAACAYEAPNKSPYVTYARIYCQHVTGTDITIQGLNFQSAYLGGDCLVLEIAGSVTGGGTVHIIGNNFHNGPNCNSASNNFMVKVDGGTDNVIFDDNQVNGAYASYSNTYNEVAMVVANGSGTFTAEYNAILNAPQRPFSTVTPTVLFQYNYIQGIVMYAGLEHGEVDENQPATAQDEVAYVYNTVLIPSNQPASTDTAPFYCTVPSASAGLIVENCKIDHNVVVANSNAGAATTSAAALEIAYGKFINVWFTNNYVDGTGALWCAADTSGSAQNITGNIAGNLLTVTSVPTGAYIPIGTTVANQISYIVDEGAGVAYQTPILKQMSGVGNREGTYSVGGAAQKVTITAGQVQPAPIVGTLTWDGDYSLVSGKAIPLAWNAKCP